MALVVENGTGLATADSYLSVADADAYHSNHGHTTWTGTDSVKEIALRNATLYIDSRYTFAGNQLYLNQALEFPRDFLLFAQTDYWPQPRVQKACAELALRSLLGEDLFADVATDSAVKREKVGPLETEYFGRLNNGQKRYTIADRLLGPLTAGGGGGSARIERAS